MKSKQKRTRQYDYDLDWIVSYLLNKAVREIVPAGTPAKYVRSALGKAWKLWPDTPAKCVRSAERASYIALAEAVGYKRALREEVSDVLTGVPSKIAADRTEDELCLGVIRALKRTSDPWSASYIYRAAKKDNLDFLCRVTDMLNRPPAKKESMEWLLKFSLIRYWVCSMGRGIPPLCFWTDQVIADFFALSERGSTFDSIRKTRQRLLLKKTTPLIRTLKDLQLLLTESGR